MLLQRSGGRAREEAAKAAEASEETVADNGATSRGRRVRTLLTSEHERDEDDDHDQDDQDDQDEDEGAEEEAVVEEKAVGDEGNVETNDDSARGGLERCSNSHIPASNRPGRRTGWRGAPKCRKQVA